MLKFIQNTGDYFSGNYFDEDFGKKVADKSGHNAEAIKTFQKKISGLKDTYFRFKQHYLEGRLRTKDKVTETHRFHTRLLHALGYDASQTEYDELFHLDEKAVLPVRHTLYRGENPHLMVMEMQAQIKDGDHEPGGLFEQQYHSEELQGLSNKLQGQRAQGLTSANSQKPTTNSQLRELKSREAESPRFIGAGKYHRSQWSNVFSVPEGLSVSPMVINEAVSRLFLLDQHRRPHYILLCAGNIYYLLEHEKWFRGSYLQFDLEELFSEAAIKRDYYSLFYFLLAKETLAPQSEMVLMEQLDEDSHKSAYEVTKDLKEGVINAVEALANEAVHYLAVGNKSLVFGSQSDDQSGEPEKPMANHQSLKAISADTLKNDCLTYVYRLLFLFYAESRGDLDILPANDAVYQQGYSLEMLRDLEQVPLSTASSQDGYFFHESLQRLFGLLSTGYQGHTEAAFSQTFRVRQLDSPLFDDSKLGILSRVKIRNIIWQDVISQLSLSRKQKGKARGRISYANLGINQLGSVYESLLAFRGFFAEGDYSRSTPQAQG